MIRYMVDGDDDDNIMEKPIRVLANSMFRAQQDIGMYIALLTVKQPDYKAHQVGEMIRNHVISNACE